MGPPSGQPYHCRLVTAAAHSTAGKQSQHGGYSTLLCFYQVSSLYCLPASQRQSNYNTMERQRFSQQNDTKKSLFGDQEVTLSESHILTLVLSTG